MTETAKREREKERGWEQMSRLTKVSYGNKILGEATLCPSNYRNAPAAVLTLTSLFYFPFQ